MLKSHVFSGRNAELITFLADLGILLLFFFVGLQIKMTEFRKNVSESAFVAFFNTAVPFTAGFLVFRYLFDASFVSSIVIGMCLSVSSQAVSLAVLDELKLLKSKISQHIITTGAVDDLFELALISVVLTLIHAAAGHESTASVLTDVAIFVAAIVSFRYVIVPVLMDLFAEEKSMTHLFTGAIVITLVLALVTLYLGLGAIIGALFAGIIVREVLLTGKHQKPLEEHNIAKAIHIVSFGFLVPVFFAWVGMNTDITAVITEWKMVSILVVIAIIGTVGGSIIGMKAHGGKLRDGYILGWGLTPKGDVELVIATLALSNSLITQSMFSALIMMALFTTMIGPIFFRALMKKHYKRKRA
jgi:Kef-type K+ transport system membrane component KefB